MDLGSPRRLPSGYDIEEISREDELSGKTGLQSEMHFHVSGSDIKSSKGKAVSPSYLSFPLNEFAYHCWCCPSLIGLGLRWPYSEDWRAATLQGASGLQHRIGNLRLL